MGYHRDPGRQHQPSPLSPWMQKWQIWMQMRPVLESGSTSPSDASDQPQPLGVRRARQSHTGQTRRPQRGMSRILRWGTHSYRPRLESCLPRRSLVSWGPDMRRASHLAGHEVHHMECTWSTSSGHGLRWAGGAGRQKSPFPPRDDQEASYWPGRGPLSTGPRHGWDGRWWQPA